MARAGHVRHGYGTSRPPQLMNASILRRGVCSFLTGLLAAFSAFALDPGKPGLSGAAFDKKLTRDVAVAPPAGPVTTSYAGVVERVLPSVVSISTYSKLPRQTFRFEYDVPPGELDHLPPLFRDFFGDWLERRDSAPPRRPKRPPPSKPVQTGLGSGVILTDDGYILTNNHVVERADDLKITIAGKDRQFSARVIGADPQTDVALIKIEASGLTPAIVGDSSKLRVGDVVLAVGSPMGLEQSVTQGIVSGLGRSNLGIIGNAELGQPGYEDFIQTDAAINPGNSGGPLLDAHGRVIGLNAAIETRSGMFAGIGLAIPINMAVGVVRELLDEGKVQRGFLGIEMDRIDPGLADLLQLQDGGGVVVNSVVNDSPAERAGFQEGDTIVSLDGEKISSPSQLRLMVSAHRPGTDVRFGVMRFDHGTGRPQRLELTATLQALPEKPASATDRPGSAESGGGASSPAFLDGVKIDGLTAENREAYALSEDLGGVVVTEVRADSDASRGGLEVGDVIVQINRRPVQNVQDARDALAAAGDKLLLKIVRDGRSKFLVVAQ